MKVASQSLFTIQQTQSQAFFLQTTTTCTSSCKHEGVWRKIYTEMNISNNLFAPYTILHLRKWVSVFLSKLFNCFLKFPLSLFWPLLSLLARHYPNICIFIKVVFWIISLLFPFWSHSFQSITRFLSFLVSFHTSSRSSELLILTTVEPTSKSPDTCIILQLCSDQYTSLHSPWKIEFTNFGVSG